MNVYNNCRFRQGGNDSLIIDTSKSGLFNEVILRNYSVMYNKDREIIFVKNNRPELYYYPAADYKFIQN